MSADDRLFAAVSRSDDDDAYRSDDDDEYYPGAAGDVLQAIADGANVNAVRNDCSPLYQACYRGNDQIVGILLNAGADARWSDSHGLTAVAPAIESGRLSTVKQLIHHDNRLLDTVDNDGWTPLMNAIVEQRSDIVRFLLDSGADAHRADHDGETALMIACEYGRLEITRQLLAAGVAMEARDEKQQTALHYAGREGANQIISELILQHNANMFAVDRDGHTPFDVAYRSEVVQTADVIDHLLEMYANKLTQDHDRLALHELLQVAEYSFAEDEELFHPPLNPLRIILPLGKLTVKHLRTLLHTLDPELIRSRDDTGKLPIHIACQTNAPVEVLTFILGLDPTTLHIADSTGALPIHLLCGRTPSTADYASVRYLVEQGGAGTVAARDRQGLLPLHVLCACTNPPLRAVQYLIQSFPGSVSMQTNAGQYPFMMAAAADSSLSLASLSVIYEVVRAKPGLVVPR